MILLLMLRKFPESNLQMNFTWYFSRFHFAMKDRTRTQRPQRPPFNAVNRYSMYDTEYSTLQDRVTTTQNSNLYFYGFSVMSWRWKIKFMLILEHRVSMQVRLSGAKQLKAINTCMTLIVKRVQESYSNMKSISGEGVGPWDCQKQPSSTNCQRGSYMWQESKALLKQAHTVSNIFKKYRTIYFKGWSSPCL